MLTASNGGNKHGERVDHCQYPRWPAAADSSRPLLINAEGMVGSHFSSRVRVPGTTSVV
jgi:hypothetical protein